MERPPTVGINFGADFLTFAINEGQYIELAKERTCVAFTESGYLTGEEAYQHWNEKPLSPRPRITLILGRRADDTTVQREIEDLGINVVSIRGKTYFKIHQEVSKRYHCVEEIASSLVAKLKKRAEQILQTIINDCVITVANNCTTLQEAALINICSITDMNVVHIVKESVASVVGFASFRETDPERRILVFDLTTLLFNISILVYSEDGCEVKSCEFSEGLGGNAFYWPLLDYFEDHLKQQSMNYFPWNVNKSRNFKKAFFETTWRKDAFRISLHYIRQMFRVEITYSTFKDMYPSLVTNISQLVTKSLRNANMAEHEIDEVYIVQSTNLLYNHIVRRTVIEIFPEEKVFVYETESEVCRGVACLAMLVDRFRWCKHLPWNFDYASFRFIFTEMVVMEDNTALKPNVEANDRTGNMEETLQVSY